MDKPPRILILTERFFPEEFLINDLAAEWKARGYAVEVLTQVPSYPHDKVFEGYKNRWFQTTQELGGIPVHRVRTLTGYNASVVKKILNYLSFACLTTLWALFRGWRYSHVFIYHTGPLTMAVAGLTLHHLQRKPCTIWTQDVWPDTVYAYGFKPSWWKRLLLNNFVRLIYSATRTITVSSPSFIQKLAPYTKKTVRFVPQWTKDTTEPKPAPNNAKRVFTFAGNLGSVQNLDELVDAFGQLAPANAELRIVGGGISLEPLREQVKAKGYTNILLPGRQPQSAMAALFAESDVLIISLKPEFAMTLPAKFQAYIAAGRPLFGVLGGDTAALIREHHLGVAVDPTPEAIQEGFKRLLNTPPEQLRQWGENARALSNAQFNRSLLINSLTHLLLNPKA